MATTPEIQGRWDWETERDTHIYKRREEQMPRKKKPISKEWRRRDGGWRSFKIALEK